MPDVIDWVVQWQWAVLCQWVEFIDQCRLVPLAIVTVAVRFAGKSLIRDKVDDRLSTLFGTSFVLGFVYYRWLTYGEDIPALIGALLRGGLAYQLILHVTQLVQLTYHQTLRWFVHVERRFIDGLSQGLQAVRPWWSRRRHSRSTPPRITPPPRVTPPPVSRTVRMRTAAQAAQDAYQQELALIDTMPLDDDEATILKLQAKQRLLQSLSEVTQS